MARRALALAPDDPLAQEALRLLEDDGPSPLHRVNPEGAALLAQAERLFAQRRYADALGTYEEVMRLDPQFSGAWVGAGDCWFAQQAWARAESLFRRATEIEAHNSQAWRYLADTLHAQGRLPAAEQALLAAVAADPAQRTNWVKLASLRAGAGLPLKRLQLQRGAGVTIGADGNARVTVDGDLHGASPTPDASLRLALALAEASARLADKENQAGRPRSPYEIELAAWHSALQASTEQRGRRPGLERSRPAADAGARAGWPAGAGDPDPAVPPGLPAGARRLAGRASGRRQAVHRPLRSAAVSGAGLARACDLPGRTRSGARGVLGRIGTSVPA